ncbi:MAG TPA: hypothetical protein VG347_03505 [Verrucomicrobiae bacterium]|nr:hypothetical protein [Verrucomicrobiae bacterium]
MDVTAYTYGTGAKIELGAIAEQIWVNGFKYSQDRAIQPSKPINAIAPNLYDRLGRMTDFSFAAGRSFGGSTAVADALAFMTSHADKVPAIADIQFVTQGGEAWLNYCGIKRIELVDKKGALVVFGYPIIGGTWSTKRNF